MSAPSASSASPHRRRALLAASASSSSGPAASVTVEDESTKKCSSCLQDRPESAYSSAQLKKKGKRVCHSCVNKKDTAAAAQHEAAAEAASKARKDAMKDAFATRLNSTLPHAASECLCCQWKAAVRSVACIRCSVPCCSLKCFERHDCDTYLEAKRTMPTDLIPEEDRFHSPEDIVLGWKELSDYMRDLPASVCEDAAEQCAQGLYNLRELDRRMLRLVEKMRLSLRELSSPRVSRPWWHPATSEHVRLAADKHRALVTDLINQTMTTSHLCASIISRCAAAMVDPSSDPMETVHGAWVHVPTIECTSPCFLPGRLLHKLLTLVRFVVRTMGSEWVAAHFVQPGEISNDAFGLFPSPSFSEAEGRHDRLGYLELPAPDTGLRTLVPLVGYPRASSRCTTLRQHLGHRELLMMMAEGQLLLDRGLFLLATERDVDVCAVSGWTGNAVNSFLVAPVHSWYWHEPKLIEKTNDPDIAAAAAIREELQARKRPDYFHIVPAIKQMIPENEWPNNPGSQLFIATPQLGIESELVELSLLESLVEEAAAGDAQAQLLLTHIEEKCAAPIAEVIARQKSRLEQMLEDQAAQLRIHAEAVARAELRGRIKAAAVEGSSEGAASSSIGPSSSSSSSASASALAPTSAASSSSALAPSSAASAVPPSAAAGSSTALTSVSSTSAASGESAVSFSWTASKTFTSLADVCTAGRAKYKTITSAALRFLHTLRPVSVNRSGGSHTVFHFASGKPVTLVQPHGGDGSVSRHAATRLYAVLHEAALQQLSPPEALPSASSRRRAALTDASS